MHGGKQFQCKECDFKGSYGGVVCHKKTVHRKITYQCDLCSHKATQKSSLKSHMNSKHFGIKHPCHECEYQAPRIDDLNKHLHKKHYSSQANKINKNLCVICNYISSSSFDKETNIYQCESCYRLFKGI